MKQILFFTALLVLPTLFLQAQSNDPELEYIKKTYSQDKKTIVADYLQLTVDQGAKFWPLYANYEKKREKLAVERLKLIQKYIDQSDTITSTQADKIIMAALNNSISLDKLNLETYTKAKTAVGARKAAQFIQLESYLQTMWRSYVQENIPLIGELDNK
jgi:hypothetical protein